MSAETRLREITDQLEEAKRFKAEKRAAYRAMRIQAGKHTTAWYETLVVAALAYAAADDRVEELSDLFEDAQTDAHYEYFRLQQLLEPELGIESA